MVEKKDIYSAPMKALADATRTVLILVSRPEAAAMNEAARTYKGLSEIGVANMELLINGVFKTSDQSDPIAVALTKRGQSALEQMPDVLKSIEQVEIPLRASQVLGIDALREFLNGSDAAVNKIEPIPVNLPPGMDEVLDDLARDGHGVIMTMGKGGVGKTTLATRMARDLAARGLDVLLTTTDPVADAVGDLPDRLEVDQVDPAVEVEKYRAHVMATAGASLNDDGRALLQEDLNSPCTEEIAVFQAFARTVNQAKDKIVVPDTAPTGHTILLLDAAEAYHREVSRLAGDIPEAVSNLLPRLRDTAFTRVFICALAEATPVHEAANLQ